MEIKPEGKNSTDWVGIIERIALVLVFAFAVYLIMNNSDWIKAKYRYAVLSVTGQSSDADYDLLHGSLNNQVITMLLADTPEKLQKGLSSRELISAKQGMLFNFGEADRHGIWMKDMLFSIDIMWFDENFKAVKVLSNVSPDTFPQVFEPDVQSLYVLEMRAGFVERYNVDVGSELVLYD